MEWISVKERLPERGVQVLVLEWGRIGIGARPSLTEMQSMKDIYEMDFPEHTFDSGDWTGPSTEITHWQPLPEPPKIITPKT